MNRPLPTGALLGLLALLTACAPGEAAFGGDGDVDKDPDTDADTDVGTDPDTDVDTDISDDLDGEYTARVDLFGWESSFGLEDACVGEGLIVVDSDADPPLSGELTCEFEGVLEYLGPQTAILSGVIEDGRIDGEVFVDLLGEPIEDEWQGEIGGDALRGSFDGGFVYDYEGFELQIEYAAEFTGQR